MTSEMEMPYLEFAQPDNACIGPVFPHHAPMPPFQNSNVYPHHYMLEVYDLLFGFIGDYSMNLRRYFELWAFKQV